MIKKTYDEKVQADREQYEKENIEKAKKAKEQWESDIKDKDSLTAHKAFMIWRLAFCPLSQTIQTKGTGGKMGYR